LHRHDRRRVDLIDERAERSGEEGLCALSIVRASNCGLGVLEHEHGCGSRVGEGGDEASSEGQQVVAAESVLGELFAKGCDVKVHFGGDHPSPELCARYPGRCVNGGL
jgi:hypothetical protein